jgi:hypothetical protein
MESHGRAGYHVPAIGRDLDSLPALVSEIQVYGAVGFCHTQENRLFRAVELCLRVKRFERLC